MSVDVTKMPKLGFGMMRLPEKDGELDLEFQQGQTHRLTAGMSFHVPEGEKPHRVHSKEGAVLFILD